MKKQDILIVGILITLVVFLGPIDRFLFKTFNPEGYEKAQIEAKQAKEKRRLAAEAKKNGTVPEEGSVSGEPPVIEAGTGTGTTPPTVKEGEPPVVVETQSQTLVLTNELMQVTLNSRGAAVTQATLLSYEMTLEDASPVVMTFSNRPSLVYADIPGLDGAVFSVKETEPGRAVEFQATGARGLVLTRRVRLGDDYRISVEDEFYNPNEDAFTIPRHSLSVGEIQKIDAFVVGPTLGVDVLLQESGKVEHYENKLQKESKRKENRNTLTQYERLGAYDWISVKNKFFTHLVSFEESELPAPMGVSMYGLYSAEEKMMMTASADNNFAAVTLDPNSRNTRTMTYFVGPKVLDELKEMGEDKSGVMQFYGFMAPKVIVVPISKLLLNLLNWIHGHLPFGGYGLAIILLTLVVRTAFWPLTHKSAISMKKMQKLAPEVNALKEKFKDNPQKQQQEMLLLYRKNKVNPMSGCLPILVQFPVFIALFFVIRSAVELRFESFLWIRDLSEPENLLADVLPFGINLLPFGMAATMLLQQRMMPTTADPMQQKMMKFMPLMMLVFMYRMPAGLMLYWSTSNLLAILQQMHTRSQAMDEVEEEAASKKSASPLSKAPVKKKKKKKD